MADTDAPAPRRHAPRGPIKARPDPMRENDPVRGPEWRGCTAKSKRSGRPCNGIAIRGGTVCRMHGGSAPQVKQAAEARWSAALVPIAVRRTSELIEQREYPSTAFAASKFVLESEYGKAAESMSMELKGDEALIAALYAGRKRAAEARKGQ